MESKTKNSWRQSASADYTILIQFFYFWYALLLAPVVASYGFSTLLSKDPVYQLGIVLVCALLVEPIGMVYLAKRRKIVHTGFGITALICHGLITICIAAITIQAFGVDIKSGFQWWFGLIIAVLILKELFVAKRVLHNSKETTMQPTTSSKKEAWAQVSIMFFSAMAYSAFWTAGIHVFSLNTNAKTLGSMFLLTIVFVIMHMSSNVTLFLMNKDGKLNKQAFVKTTISSMTIALIPLILQFIR